MLAVVLLGCGIVATSVEDLEGGGFSESSECLVEDDGDCAIVGVIQTADGQQVDERVEVTVEFGPHETMEPMIVQQGGGIQTVVENPDGTDTTVALDAGEESVEYETDPVEGYEQYAVVATVTNGANWDIRGASDLNLETVNLAERDGPIFVEFELVPEDPEDPDEDSDDEEVTSWLPERHILAALGLVALLGALAAVFVLSQRDGLPENADEQSEDEDEPATIGEIAGDAADRIENEPSHANEVYRAWDEMTDTLDVADPETTTPGEFERLAVDAGMDPADVRELTELFEAVRYGDQHPEAYEDRAVEVLRRVEDTYADEEGEP